MAIKPGSFSAHMQKEALNPVSALRGLARGGKALLQGGKAIGKKVLTKGQLALKGRARYLDDAGRGVVGPQAGFKSMEQAATKLKPPAPAAAPGSFVAREAPEMSVLKAQRRNAEKVYKQQRAAQSSAPKAAPAARSGSGGSAAPAAASTPAPAAAGGQSLGDTPFGAMTPGMLAQHMRGYLPTDPLQAAMMAGGAGLGLGLLED